MRLPLDFATYYRCVPPSIDTAGRSEGIATTDGLTVALYARPEFFRAEQCSNALCRRCA
jgi:hypothetical protein